MTIENYRFSFHPYMGFCIQYKMDYPSKKNNSYNLALFDNL